MELPPSLAVAATFTTLDPVVRWALTEGHELVDAHQMDEFTFDVVVRVHDDLVLVFDST